MKSISKLIILLFLPLVFSMLVTPAYFAKSSENSVKVPSDEQMTPAQVVKQANEEVSTGNKTQPPQEQISASQVQQQVEEQQSKQLKTVEPSPPPIKPPVQEQKQPVFINFKLILIGVVLLIGISAILVLIKRVLNNYKKSGNKPKAARKKQQDTSGNQPETVSEAVTSFIRHRNNNY